MSNCPGFAVNNLTSHSVTAPVRVVDARQTTLYACLVSERSPTTKCIPKGAYTQCDLDDQYLTGLSYVEMLENQQAQLVAGLQELYKRSQNGQGWTGPALKETSHGMPLTHDILEHLGALRQEGHITSESFEEDLHALQQRLIANGASLMQREPSHDSSSEGAPSPVYEPIPHKPKFSNPFPVSQFPPTPPNRSPYPQAVRAVSQHKAQTYPQVNAPSNLAWATPASDFDDGMDYMNQYDSPMMDNTLDMPTFPAYMYNDQMGHAAINPFLTIKDWTGQDEVQQYVNPAMI